MQCNQMPQAPVAMTSQLPRTALSNCESKRTLPHAVFPRYFLKNSFILCVCAFCVYVCLCSVCMPGACGSQKMVWGHPGTGVTVGSELPCGCWELNPVPGRAASAPNHQLISLDIVRYLWQQQGKSLIQRPVSMRTGLSGVGYINY